MSPSGGPEASGPGHARPGEGLGARDSEATGRADHLLEAVLGKARARGLLGPGSVRAHITHARALARCVPPPAAFLDLGSGGGVPGLVLALAWPRARGALLDSRRRACLFLTEAIAELELAPRVYPAQGRAEDLARARGLRGAFDVVVARSFGPPAVTAECGVGFLGSGGRLVVSEPPGEGRADDRWPREGLERLGLAGPEVCAEGASAVVLTLELPPGPGVPRRAGIPAKRPLW